MHTLHSMYGCKRVMRETGAIVLDRVGTLARGTGTVGTVGTLVRLFLVLGICVGTRLRGRGKGAYRGRSRWPAGTHPPPLLSSFLSPLVLLPHPHGGHATIIQSGAVVT